MGIEQASSFSRVPDERATARDDLGRGGRVFGWMSRTVRVAPRPGSRSARADDLAPLARDAGVPARSAAYERYLRALRRRTRSIQAWQLGVVVVFLILWEVAPRAQPDFSDEPGDDCDRRARGDLVAAVRRHPGVGIDDAASARRGGRRQLSRGASR